MELFFGIVTIIIGIMLIAFNEELIKLLGTDKYYDHKKDKYRKIIVGIGTIILGIWVLLDYFIS
ncbi:MAG: hypothetical protein KKF62_14060 [Bacteroidetes bacterium]|nr:hypothetical protein [Bacteroidota bacterium]MBU1114208.1 hypothetical protein [Bacteroidota bacterium]MBU1797017.1 hypothetical protein [Bacteroidota bacterium]